MASDEMISDESSSGEEDSIQGLLGRMRRNDESRHANGDGKEVLRTPLDQTDKFEDYERLLTEYVVNRTAREFKGAKECYERLIYEFNGGNEPDIPRRRVTKNSLEKFHRWLRIQDAPLLQDAKERFVNCGGDDFDSEVYVS